VFRTKSPKVVVVGISEPRAEYGHPEFRNIAPASAIAFPPAPLLHNALYDLASLPARQTRLAFARVFPQLADLPDTFDAARYAASRSDFSTGRFVIEGKPVDMEAKVPGDVLEAEPLVLSHATGMTRLLKACCNEGDDHVYIRAIAELARAHGARVIFTVIPNYDRADPLSDRAFLSQYGVVIDNGDLAKDSTLFYNHGHLNHAGAVIASDRIASAVAALETAMAKSAN
jgi:hypothetical protein